MGSIRQKNDDGKLVARFLRANNNLSNKGIDAIWEIINTKNEDLYWTLRELHALTDERLIDNVPKQIRDYIEEYLQDNFSEWQKPITLQNVTYATPLPHQPSITDLTPPTNKTNSK